MLYVSMLCVSILHVSMLYVSMLYVSMLHVSMLHVSMLCASMLYVSMLHVSILNCGLSRNHLPMDIEIFIPEVKIKARQRLGGAAASLQSVKSRLQYPPLSPGPNGGDDDLSGDHASPSGHANPQKREHPATPPSSTRASKRALINKLSKMEAEHDKEIARLKKELEKTVSNNKSYQKKIQNDKQYYAKVQSEGKAAKARDKDLSKKLEKAEDAAKTMEAERDDLKEKLATTSVTTRKVNQLERQLVTTKNQAADALKVTRSCLLLCLWSLACS